MKLIKKDKSSLTPSYRFTKNIYKINKKFLENKKNKKKKLYRYCLNKSQNDKLHQMLIFQSKNYKGQIKKHPTKDKSYHLLEGRQLITIYHENGKIKKKIILDKKNFFLWIKKNIYHANITLSKKSIHIETIAGPFNRKQDRRYLRIK